MKVSVIGLGKMGLPIARQLLDAGHAVVTYDADPTRQQLATEFGATAADSPRAAGAASEVSLSVLVDYPVTNSALFGEDGALTDVAPGHLHVCMGTIGVTGSRALAQQCAAAGIDYAEATMSGSAPTIEAGQITVMVGGTTQQFAVLDKLLEPISRVRRHLGPVGAASMAKLVINALVTVVNGALAETLNLTERLGYRLAPIYDAIADSVVASPYVAYKRPTLLDFENTPVMATVQMLHKDVELALDAAQTAGVFMPTIAAAAAELAAASSAGYAQADVGSVLQYLATADPAARLSAITEADSARLTAMATGDLETLDRLLTDDCMYVHSNGSVDTKAQYLDKLRDGTYGYTWVTGTDQQYVDLGTAVLIAHRMDAELVLSGVPRPYSSQATVIWRTTLTGPRLCYFQGSPILAPVSAPPQ